MKVTSIYWRVNKCSSKSWKFQSFSSLKWTAEWEGNEMWPTGNRKHRTGSYPKIPICILRIRTDLGPCVTYTMWKKCKHIYFNWHTHIHTVCFNLSQCSFCSSFNGNTVKHIIADIQFNSLELNRRTKRDVKCVKSYFLHQILCFGMSPFTGRHNVAERKTALFCCHL